MTIRTLALGSGVTSIQDHRLTLGAFMAPGASALERRGGLYYYPGAADLTSAAALQANVSPFVAVVDGTSNSLQGQVIVVVDTAVTLTFSAGEPSVARTDRVVLQVRDTTYDASGSTDARVLIVKGNTSTGVANAVPASSLLLWEVVVPIGASSITFSSARVDRRQWTSTPLRVPVNSSTERDALPTIPGMEVTRLDNGNIEQYWSGAWRTIAPGATPTRYLVANQAARDALTPTTGLEVTRLDTGDVEQYWSGAWRVLGASSPSAAVSRQISLFNPTTSTPSWAAVPSGNWAPMTVQVSSSGRVLVGIHAEMISLVSGLEGSVAFDLNPRPPGTWDFRDYSCLIVDMPATPLVAGGTSHLFTGMTPGSLTITPFYRTDTTSTSANTEIRRGMLWATGMP